MNHALQLWEGPFGGLPPFDRVGADALEPALIESMRACRAEIDAIAADPAVPSFENTCRALDLAGAPMRRALALYEVHVGTLGTPATRALETRMSPLLAAFNDATVQNAALFHRLDTLRREDAAAPWPQAEARRLLETQHRHFLRAGAGLDGPAQQRIQAINQRLASLFASFRHHQLADEEKALDLQAEADLDGLPAGLREAAARSAAEAGMKGRWRIANTRSAAEAFLIASTRRDLREKVWQMWVGRGDNGDANDNKAVIIEILRLRSERARLLGFASHAHWVTDDNMAQTPEAALGLLMRVWPAARERARSEIADMQAFADREGAGLRIEPWDYRHYAEKVRLERYALDDEALKPYLQLDRLREAMFWAAGRLFGLDFAKIEVAVAHPDITAYSVSRGGAAVGVWYFDPYARPGKSSGAWMSEYRTQHRGPAGAVLPIVSNNSNFIPGRPGEPVLISWSDAVTLFHEFGHALHGLCSDVACKALAGTAVKNDFVEFPSQLYERWLDTPELLGRFALHHRTGAPMPAALLAAIERSRVFNEGFRTCEYLTSALYDLKVHLAAAEGDIDPVGFERALLAEIGCPHEITMRHRPTHFGHLFAGDSYSAGYYVYLWADVLTADAAEAFAAAPGGYYDAALAGRLLAEILSVGNSVPPDDAYRRFRGRDASADALMRHRGFPVAA